jgi:hypothetical protein
MSEAVNPGPFVHRGLTPYVVYFLVGTANLAFASLCFAVQESQPDLAVYGAYVASAVWLLVAWWSWYAATGRVADVYWLFVLAVWLFNGGGLALPQLIRPEGDQAFHEFQHSVFRTFTRTGVVSAFHLVLFCLSAMHAGALLAVSRWPAQRADHSAHSVAVKDLSLRWIGLGLLAVSLGPALWMMRVSAARVREGGYMALYQEDGGATEGLIFMLASGLVPGAFYLMGSDLDNRFLRRLGWSLVMMFSVGVLALGTRALFFQNAVALLWLRHYGVRPIRKTVWAGLIVAGLLLSGIVFWARDPARQADLTLENLPETGEEAVPNAGGVLSEMGYSVMAVVYTMDLVPAVRDFSWGESYLTSLLAVVPGLTADRESEESWLTYMVSPETAAIGGGLGFSFIAEAYLNFGIGAPLALGLAGLCLGHFAGWSHAGGRSGRLAFAACAISILLFSARASSLSFVRRVLVLCVLPYFVLACERILEARARRTVRVIYRGRGRDS